MLILEILKFGGNNMLRPNSEYASYSLMLSVIAVGLMLSHFISSLELFPFIFDIGFIFLGISFILSSNTEVNCKTSFYLHLICGTIIIILSLFNIYKQL